MGRASLVFLLMAAACFAAALAMSLRMDWFASRYADVDRLAMAVMSGYVVFMLLFQWQVLRRKP